VGLGVVVVGPVVQGLLLVLGRLVRVQRRCMIHGSNMVLVRSSIKAGVPTPMYRRPAGRGA
jgi:hypothetical protein